jgi:hypothetical protein
MTRPVKASRGAARAPERTSAESSAVDEIERWRRAAIPDRSTPLDVEDIVRLLRDCVAALRLDLAIVGDVTANTIHYYRRKDVIDPPIGKTAAARYGLLHLWQAAGARLAGHLGLVTLAEARGVIRGADERTSLGFFAARVVDARARDAVRGPAPAEYVKRDLRPLPRTGEPSTPRSRAVVIDLPGNAWCVIPDGHPALRSRVEASALARAFAAALDASTQH